MKTAWITQRWSVWCLVSGLLLTGCHLSLNARSEQAEIYSPITGVSDGDTFDRARQNAEADLKEKVEKWLIQSSKTGLAETTEFLLQKAQTTVRWFSSSNTRFTATAIIDINVVINDLVESASSQNKSFEQKIERAQKLLTDGSDGYGALSQSLATLDEPFEIEKKQRLIKTLDPRYQGFSIAPSREDLVKRVLEWISQIEMRPAFGNEQHITSGQTLTMPIGLWVQWTHDGKQIAMAGFPVRFFLSGMEGNPLSTGATNALGIASASVSYLPKPDDKLYAGIDSRAILSQAGLSSENGDLLEIKKRLDSIQAPFEWHLYDSTVSRVVLFIREKNSDQLQPSDQAESVKELLTILENEGYSIQVSEVSDTDQAHVPEPLATYLKDRADFIILGDVESEVEQKISDGLVFALAKGKIQVVNVSNGSVVGTIVELSKGAGQDAYSAQLRSIVNFSQKIKNQLLGMLKRPDTAATPSE